MPYVSSYRDGTCRRYPVFSGDPYARDAPDTPDTPAQDVLTDDERQVIDLVCYPGSFGEG